MTPTEYEEDSSASDIPNFSLELAENLAHTSPDENGMGPDYGAPIFACHESREGGEIACAGWLATVGGRHPAVRLWIFNGKISADQLEPKPGWPKLLPDFKSVIEKLRRTI